MFKNTPFRKIFYDYMSCLSYNNIIELYPDNKLLQINLSNNKKIDKYLYCQITNEIKWFNKTGDILFLDNSYNYGKYIIFRHEDGYTVYYNNKKITIDKNIKYRNLTFTTKGIINYSRKTKYLHFLPPRFLSLASQYCKWSYTLKEKYPIIFLKIGKPTKVLYIFTIRNDKEQAIIRVIDNKKDIINCKLVDNKNVGELLIMHKKKHDIINYKIILSKSGNLWHIDKYDNKFPKNLLYTVFYRKRKIMNLVYDLLPFLLK